MAEPKIGAYVLSALSLDMTKHGATRRIRVLVPLLALAGCADAEVDGRPVAPVATIAFPAVDPRPPIPKPAPPRPLPPRPKPAAQPPKAPPPPSPPPPAGDIAPLTVAIPETAKIEPGPPLGARLQGLSENQVVALLGQPAATEEKAPARIWTYRGGGCRLRVAFFPQMETLDYRVLSAEQTGADDDIGRARCDAAILGRGESGT